MLLVRLLHLYITVDLQVQCKVTDLVAHCGCCKEQALHFLAIMREAEAHAGRQWASEVRLRGDIEVDATAFGKFYISKKCTAFRAQIDEIQSRRRQQGERDAKAFVVTLQVLGAMERNGSTLLHLSDPRVLPVGVRPPTESLLEARRLGLRHVEVCHQRKEFVRKDRKKKGKGIWHDPWEDLPSLDGRLKQLKRVVRNLHARDLSELLCELSLVIWQLRAWFTVGSALLVLQILNRIADMPYRLPTTDDGGDPGLAALRIIEGYILFCCAYQDNLKSEVGQTLSRILKKKRLPPCTSVRVEAALAGFQCLEVPEVSLQELQGEDFLDCLAIALAPDLACRERMEIAKHRLEIAVEGTFGPDARFEFFGSAVNGFETSSSDVDVVVVLPEGHELRSSSKQAAAFCVDLMGKKLVEMEEEWGIYVTDLVTNARVPVLKCRCKDLLEIDITFNNLLPLYNSRLLKAYASLDARVAKLGRLVKFWAKQRQVNEALEGTLSSYSHCILLINFLQRKNILPILQEKNELEAFARDEMFDGIHDVWFLDPSKELTCESAEWQTWAMNRPKEATLRGLLTGYFRDLAYSLKAHSSVASIRFRGHLHKEDYFRRMLQRKKELEVKVPLVVECEEAEAGPEVPEEAEEAEAHEDVPDDDEADAAVDAAEADPTAAVEVAETPPLGPVKVEDFEPPALKYKLPAEEHELQQAMSQRQVLCIDDPMELGRSLGASFQGFERLCFEWRRAFHHLTRYPECTADQDLSHLRELFRESNVKAIFQLERHRNFANLVEKSTDRPSRSNKIPWAPGSPYGGKSWTGSTGRSWHNGAAWRGEGRKGKGYEGRGEKGESKGEQGETKGDTKGSSFYPEPKGESKGHSFYDNKSDSKGRSFYGWGGEVGREGKGAAQTTHARASGTQGGGNHERAEGKGLWQ
ncbi:unnamed protein product [Durusdinium trenchii]|uniref:Poly(A) RNA polymerase mitochondrial-like central palm domain-containing protein n=1 Tax=Durusdinium trenchii TaxID=1381693 RepID=A0ABP0PQT4_9DINO